MNKKKKIIPSFEDNLYSKQQNNKRSNFKEMLEVYHIMQSTIIKAISFYNALPLYSAKTLEI